MLRPINLSMTSVIKKWKSCETGLTSYYVFPSCKLILIPLGVGTQAHTHTQTHTHTQAGTKHFKNVVFPTH